MAQEPSDGEDSLRTILNVRTLGRVGGGLLFVLAVHVAALTGLTQTGVAAVLGVCLFNAVFNALSGGPRRGLVLWLLLSALMCQVLYGANGGPKTLAQGILLPPVLLNGFFLYIFGRTLLPGREALIERMSRLEVGDLFQELRIYTRRLTWGWAIFFALCLTASILLSYADLATWSWFVNLGAPLGALGFFLGEHLYRIHRFGAFTPASPLRTLRAMSRPAVWTGSL